MRTIIRKSQIIHLIVLFYTSLSLGFAQNPQTGMCSYYADKFQGKRTASGERYKKSDFTAAHNTLPFHTWVIVTNLTNNKSVKVRINDRGPHSKSRVIDLSHAAAQKIGLIQSGTTKVKIELCAPDSLSYNSVDSISKDTSLSMTTIEAATKTSTLSEAHYKDGKFYTTAGKIINPLGYYIQLASYTNFESFRVKEEEWSKTQKKEVYCEVTLSKSKKLYRLLIGTFSSKTEAEKELTSLNKKGIKGLIKKY